MSESWGGEGTLPEYPFVRTWGNCGMVRCSGFWRWCIWEEGRGLPEVTGFHPAPQGEYLGSTLWFAFTGKRVSEQRGDGGWRWRMGIEDGDSGGHGAASGAQLSWTFTILIPLGYRWGWINLRMPTSMLQGFMSSVCLGQPWHQSVLLRSGV